MYCMIQASQVAAADEIHIKGMFILKNDNKVYTGRLSKTICDMCKLTKFWTMIHCVNVNNFLFNMNDTKLATFKFLYKLNKRTQ